jgi:hypothetical protein
LIFTELLVAIQCQSPDGTLVIRIHDVYTKPMVQLVAIMTGLYKSVSIIKPRNTKPTNSEKYIVCTSYIGVDNALLDAMNWIYNNWGNDLYCRNVGIKNNIEHVEKKIRTYNEKLMRTQLDNVDTMMGWNSTDIPENEVQSYQNMKAVEFCRSFGLPCLIDNEQCKHHKRTKINLIRGSSVCNKCLVLLM